MATVGQWIEGARPRTLPNAISPVLVGSGAAYGVDGFVPTRALLALGLALALILGVNFANDYSDGIRGADANRVGPLRLVASGSARPATVRVVALACLLLATVAGSALVVLSGHWWMAGVGALCLAGAWFYTGGRRPYGYAGLGEIAVFVFFGLVGVLGTLYLQSDSISGVAIGCAVGVGSFSASVLVANNLRDIPSDVRAGKRTLAVLLGDRDTRTLYLALVTVPFLVTTLIGVRDSLALAGFAALLLVIPAARRVARGFRGLALVPVLRDTALAMLLWSALTGAALALG